MSAVSPVASVALGSAFAPSRSATISLLRFMQARKSGVAPVSSAADARAPARNSIDANGRSS
jgi:hypothetical protein